MPSGPSPDLYRALVPHRVEIVLIESTTMVIGAAGLPLFELVPIEGVSLPVTSTCCPR